MKIEDAICAFCGCLCDDIAVEVTDNQITGVDNACTLGAARFREDLKNRLSEPIIRDGEGWKDISYDEAIRKTTDLLLSASRPLLFGWSSSATETQAAGAHLAELIGGVIDSTTTVCHGPSILAIQEVGHPGCTLGQVKNRAETVIYWGCNPIDAHPRHMSRYSTYPDGYFTKKTLQSRKVIVVDIRKTESSDIADMFIQICPGGDYAVLSALRTIVRGRPEVVPPVVAGVSKEQLLAVAEICKKTRFGALFFGLGVTMSRGKYKNVRNAIEFVDELNRHTKWTITPMRGHGNVYGSNEAFTWISGYPYAIDYSRGIAFYNPGETSAVDILRRRECDMCLIVGSDPGAHFPGFCASYLASIPTVLIDPYPNATTHLATIQIPCAINGIDAEGTTYRMDGVPIQTRKLIDTNYPFDGDIVHEIHRLVAAERRI
ncbi:MAG: formylmethanofuran dehydrogenase subunit B [Methanospirillaceae archaeon]|nr:formylmethanofuran dehydrogenase subunit B [Methanospirillaceae archaeon]